MLNWRWKQFADLSSFEVYDLIRLREQVFVAEQNCVYVDCDGRDLQAWHLLGYQGETLVATLRVLPAHLRFAEVSFGRVAVAAEFRRAGYGKELTQRALAHIQEVFGEVPVRISAQAYLEKFYRDFGFVAQGAPYSEDHIPHVEMLRG